MTKRDRFMFALAMIGAACSLLAGDDHTAIAGVAIALVCLYPSQEAKP